jgi:hypothetical protein
VTASAATSVAELVFVKPANEMEMGVPDAILEQPASVSVSVRGPEPVSAEGVTDVQPVSPKVDATVGVPVVPVGTVSVTDVGVSTDPVVKSHV